jgi:hypothetical protein
MFHYGALIDHSGDAAKVRLEAVAYLPDTAAGVKQPTSLKLALQVWRERQSECAAAYDEERQAAAELQTVGGDGAANSAPIVRKLAGFMPG